MLLWCPLRANGESSIPWLMYYVLLPRLVMYDMESLESGFRVPVWLMRLVMCDMGSGFGVHDWLIRTTVSVVGCRTRVWTMMSRFQKQILNDQHSMGQI